MRYPLKPHPHSKGQSVALLTVEAIRAKSGELSLHYALSGDTAALLIPPKAAATRTDNLWHHTCFEVFVASGKDTAYREFNLSPSTEWAAYQFTSYRKGMANNEHVPAPQIECVVKPDILELHANLVPDLPRDEPWRLAVSVVIEEKNGNKSWWALTHPQPKPDFHNPDSFTLILPSP